jgi:16S rRNA (guanine527-N7)-methyltransferase
MLLQKYFPELTSHQLQQFELMAAQYRIWNEQINVISRKDIDFIFEHHILHSLAIAKVITFKKGTRILDVGTGGGFPGIPLAVFFPDVQFHLVDSIGKKIKVVNEVAEALGLKNVKATHSRVELIDETFDFVVSRAVTRLVEFTPWVKSKFNKESVNSLPNGILYLKGGDLTSELAPYKSNAKMKLFDLSEYFEEEFFETKKVVYLGMK